MSVKTYPIVVNFLQYAGTQAFYVGERFATKAEALARVEYLGTLGVTWNQPEGADILA